MKVLIILIVLLLLSISFAGLKASGYITELNSKIKAIWETDIEQSRDCINLGIPTAQPKTNYFEYPNAFWVSDSIYHDSLYLNDIQNEIKLYVKTKYIPPSFTTDAIVYDTDWPIPLKGYYIAYCFNDSLFVISGDEYQNHFTVEANYSDVEGLISAANKYFNLPQLPPEMFTFNDWYGLTAVFEIDNKIAELRGYDRKYRLYSEEFDYEATQSPHKYGDSIYATDTLEISIIELVVYNE